MRVSMIVLLSSMCLVACGGPAKEAKSPESDPWAGYTGKYAEAGSGSGAKAAKADKADKPGKAEKTADAAPAAPVEKAADGATKVSSATIHGESVSSVGLDSLADSAKSATKGKVVSTKYLVGPKYEQLFIQMKGVSMEVIRPAANPAPDGPTFSSPKARSTADASKAESSYYDADADVAVVVKGANKAGSTKVLGSLVKH